MSHIFISYSRDDLAFARYVRALLTQEGFDVWMDEEGLSAGMNWWKEIERNIDSCAAFLVIMSPSSDGSMYVHNEILRALDQQKRIFPVLFSGQPFSLLAGVQYEDLRIGLNAKLSARFVANLREVSDTVLQRSIRFEIVQGDVRDFASDVLILKFAKRFYGADEAVASRMLQHGIEIDTHPVRETGSHMLISSQAAIAPKQLLFMGVKRLSYLGYRDVRTFTEYALHILADEAPDVKHIALTIHGPGFGLDEGEVLLAQLGGIVDALQSWNVPAGLERISFVEIVNQRVRRLRNVVTPFFEEVGYAQVAFGQDWGYDLIFSRQMEQPSPDAGTEEIKPYALAILPDEETLDDIYYYGIQRPVHSQGLLCERISLSETPQEPELLPASLQRAGSAKLLICHLAQVTPLLTGLCLGKRGSGCAGGSSQRGGILLPTRGTPL